MVPLTQCLQEGKREGGVINLEVRAGPSVGFIHFGSFGPLDQGELPPPPSQSYVTFRRQDLQMLPMLRCQGFAVI